MSNGNLPDCINVQRFFKDVQPESTLEISVDGPPGSCVLLCDVLAPDPANDQSFNLAPGQTAVSNPLNHAHAAYLVRYRLTFTTPGQSTAAIGLAVIRSDGTAHSAPVRCTVTGSNAGGVVIWVWPVITV